MILFYLQVLNIISFGCATWILIPLDYGPVILYGVKRMRRSRAITQIPLQSGGHTSFTSQFIHAVTCIALTCTCIVVIINRFWEYSSYIYGRDLRSKLKSSDYEARDNTCVADTSVPVLDTCNSVHEIQRGFQLGSACVEIKGLRSIATSTASFHHKFAWNILWL